MNYHLKFQTKTMYIENFVLILLHSISLTEFVSGKAIEVVNNNDEFVNTVPIVDPIKYLFQFGYIQDISLRANNNQNKSYTLPLISENSDEVKNAILEFQDFAGLQKSGKLDEPTLKLMQAPRCGVSDRTKEVEVKRFKRYVTHPSRWPRFNLNYFIASYPTNSILSRREVDLQISQAFSIWSEASKLTFNRVFTQADSDITLDFFDGPHGSDDPFDGRGGVLAHAFFPRWGGDVHFDAAEDWIAVKDEQKVRRGAKQLLQTAVHEIGHSLGLQHSREKRSIMAPFYQGWMDEVRLEFDDVKGIQVMYGPPERIVSTRKPKQITNKPVVIRTTTRKPVKENDYICSNTRFDAATQTRDGSFYVFRGANYWKLKPNAAGFERGYPKPNSDWSGLPGGIDAAFYDPRNGMTYIFKDEQVGKYRNLQIQPGYPRKIADEFPGAPESNIDAAMIWGKNKQLYFFKGTRYWKYSYSKRKVEDFYPRPISKVWKGVPGNLSAALVWRNGKTYFFKDDHYYRFNDELVRVDRDPRHRYPRTIGKWWLACHAEPQIEDAGSKRVPRHHQWFWDR